jgi:hypothetical protein
LGLAGVGTASGASPALHVKGDSVWTIKENIGLCETNVFSLNGTWASPGGDVGIWSGGGSAIKMKWTAGSDQGLKFRGTWVAASKEYSGTIGSDGLFSGAKLIEGAVAGC